MYSVIYYSYAYAYPPNGTLFMVLDPLPPPPPETLTPNPTPLPPKKPPDPSISIIFLKKTPYRAPDNPFRETVTTGTEEEYKHILSSVVDRLRAPFAHDNEGPFSFKGEDA